MSWTLRPRCPSLRFALLALVCAVAAAATATEFRLIDDFSEAGAVAEAYAEEFGAEAVLLVVDIDNTVLAMDDPLGSEQWFDWQVFLSNNQQLSPDLVADSFPGILEVQGHLYERGRMHPPQADLPAIVRRIQDAGVAAVVLTSRGEAFRGPTERELTRNGFDFSRTALDTRDEEHSLYMPYDPKAPAAAGISAREVSTLKLDKPQQVSYRNGIMMTSGQHKGIMLVTLLHRAAEPVKAVIFVDNRADHVAGVVDQMQEEGVAATGLVYTREDNNIKAFAYGPKDAYTAAWREFRGELAAAERAATQPSNASISDVPAETRFRVSGPKRGRVFGRRLFCR